MSLSSTTPPNPHQTIARAQLHQYRTPDNESREIVLLDGARGSRLLIDRRVGDMAEAFLLAHLARDEPDENAAYVCSEYLANSRRCCRALNAEDFAGPAEGLPPAIAEVGALAPVALIEAGGGVLYRLRASGNPAELRWHRFEPNAVSPPRIVSAREVVAAIEDYEPVCEQTRAAVAALRNDREVSIATLALELRRLEASPIVLNRQLREAVLDAVRRRGVSLSAIAIACGRMKRDPRGNGSGETSWLARRVGLIPDGATPNPWVHSDTLALIARDGLGIAPREVELG